MPTLKFKLTDDWQKHAAAPCSVSFGTVESPLIDHPRYAKPFANPRFRHARKRREYQNYLKRGITHFQQICITITKP